MIQVTINGKVLVASRAIFSHGAVVLIHKLPDGNTWARHFKCEPRTQVNCVHVGYSDFRCKAGGKHADVQR